jgi:hypothetical protein
VGEARFDEESPFADSGAFAAAVICRTECGNLHVGLLHRSDEHPTEIIHLGWEDQLRNDWNWKRLWAAPDVEPERLRSVAAMCRKVWHSYEISRKFPYALGFRGTSFDATGKLVLGDGARGLTCATLVLAMFHAVGVELVCEDSWPIRTEDDRVLLETIRRFATPPHLVLLESEVNQGVRRIQPQEVLGACACNIPAKSTAAHAAGERVCGQL